MKPAVCLHLYMFTFSKLLNFDPFSELFKWFKDFVGYKESNATSNTSTSGGNLNIFYLLQGQFNDLKTDWLFQKRGRGGKKLKMT